MTLADQARAQMVQRLVDEGRLHDVALTNAFSEVHRHGFVPDHLRAVCYDPGALEIALDQTLTCPDFVAQMVGLLNLKPEHRVLEVGTGTGYQAAILASVAAEVTTIEVRDTLLQMAVANLASQGFERVCARLGDGALGAADRGPFDAIVLGCAAAWPISETRRPSNTRRVILSVEVPHGSTEDSRHQPCSHVPCRGQCERPDTGGMGSCSWNRRPVAQRLAVESGASGRSP